jgi:Fe-S-cluster containining protein
MEQHARFLSDMTEWFCRVRGNHSDRMRCGRGCALCCHGLFDISFADALLLAAGFARLDHEARDAVFTRAAAIQANILRHEPGLDPPYFVGKLPEGRVDAIVEGSGSPRCPFLGDENECLVYASRPLACRLEGIPMVDAADGLFGDWCELNFTSGIPPEALEGLKQDYYAIQAAEDSSSEVMGDLLLGQADADLTVFMASVVTEYERFWAGLVR